MDHAETPCYQQWHYCCMHIHCRGNVFTELMPRNVRYLQSHCLALGLYATILCEHSSFLRWREHKLQSDQEIEGIWMYKSWLLNCTRDFIKSPLFENWNHIPTNKQVSKLVHVCCITNYLWWIVTMISVLMTVVAQCSIMWSGIKSSFILQSDLPHTKTLEHKHCLEHIMGRVKESERERY
jgi:hypothetical protein